MDAHKVQTARERHYLPIIISSSDDPELVAGGTEYRGYGEEVCGEAHPAEFWKQRCVPDKKEAVRSHRSQLEPTNTEDDEVRRLSRETLLPSFCLSVCLSGWMDGWMVEVDGGG